MPHMYKNPIITKKEMTQKVDVMGAWFEAFFAL